MSDPRYAYPYPAQGYYQGPPVVPPPPQYPPQPQQYPPQPQHPPQPSSGESGFLEGCLAALCCCCLLEECFNGDTSQSNPSTTSVNIVPLYHHKGTH